MISYKRLDFLIILCLVCLSCDSQKEVSPIKNNLKPSVFNESKLDVEKTHKKIKKIIKEIDSIFYKKEKVSFIEDMNLSNDQIHYVKLPIEIRDRIFESILADTNVIECRIRLFWDKYIFFDSHGLSDSIYYNFTYIQFGEDVKHMNGKKNTYSWSFIKKLDILNKDGGRKKIEGVYFYYKENPHIVVDLFVKQGGTSDFSEL